MKRILSLFVAVATAISSFAVVLAAGETFNPFDLREYGVPSFQALPLEDGSVFLDGKISSGEYPMKNRTRYGQGFGYYSSGGQEISSPPKVLTDDQANSLYQDLYLSYDEEYFYVAAVLSLPLESLVGTGTEDGYGKIYRIRLEVSLTPSSSILHRRSSLTNTYLFSPRDHSCVAVSGERIQYDETGKGRYMGRFSFSPSSQDKVYHSQDGIGWDSTTYGKWAVLDTGAGGCCVFECKIPLGDVMQTLTDEAKREVSRKLSDGTGAFCGGFSLEWCCADPSSVSGMERRICLSTGLAGASICPLSPDGEDWKTYLYKEYGVLVERVPSPLYFNAHPFGVDENVQGNESGDGTAQDENLSGSGGKEESVRVETSIVPPISSGNSVHDESIFSGLPSEDEIIPQETEIIYDEAKDEEDPETESTFGHIVTLISGILLTVTAICAGLVLRRREQMEKKDKKTSK